MPYKAASDVALKIVRNKWFWIILGAIIVIIILRRVLPDWKTLKSRYGKKYGDFQPGQIDDDGLIVDVTSGITVKRKGELEALAEEVHTGINDTFGYIQDDLEQMEMINDNELYYLAQYYKKQLTRGTSLYIDLDDELMWNTDMDEIIMMRLSQLGLA